MKKKYILMGAAAVVAVSTVVGGTLAALNTNTENGAGAAETGISLKNIGIAFVSAGEEGTEITEHLPGGSWSNPQSSVINSVENGYSIYAKVEIDRYWSKNDDNGEKYLDYAADNMAKAYIGESYTGTESQLPLQIDGQEEAYIVNDWLVGYADDEQIVMYYTKPLAEGEQSSDFLSGIYFAPEMDNSYTNTTYHVDITVTAVQANNGADAIAAELGVFPSFDDEGNIIAVSETRPESYGE
jgi:hypothetical protein